MRLLRLLLVVAGLAGAVVVARALLDGQRPGRGRPAPASLDTWPPVPKKPPTPEGAVATG